MKNKAASAARLAGVQQLLCLRSPLHADPILPEAHARLAAHHRAQVAAAVAPAGRTNDRAT